jgi:hypothetical protein
VVKLDGWEGNLIDRREGWTYQEAPGGGYYGYPSGSRPSIQWDHIDGPLLCFRNGELHWLTWRERFWCWLGCEDAYSLEKKHRPHLSRSME